MLHNINNNIKIGRPIKIRYAYAMSLTSCIIVYELALHDTYCIHLRGT